MPERDSGGQPTAEEQLRALYENAESSAAKAFEQAVGTPSFGALLARGAENVAALSRMGSDAADLVLRNLRVASRADTTRLARQLHRTEDKLERVLQEIEQLRDELARAQESAAPPEPSPRATAPRGRASARNGRASTGTRGAGGTPGGEGTRAATGTRGGSPRSRSRAT